MKLNDLLECVPDGTGITIHIGGVLDIHYVHTHDIEQTPLGSRLPYYDVVEIAANECDELFVHVDVRND